MIFFNRQYLLKYYSKPNLILGFIFNNYKICLFLKTNKDNPKNKYFCNILNMRDMYSFFKAECKKYGLLYEMHDIIREYKSNGIKGTLF